VTAVAKAAGVSRHTVYKWRARHALEGVSGLVAVMVVAEIGTLRPTDSNRR
jgi:hypothetical protein